MVTMEEFQHQSRSKELQPASGQECSRNGYQAGGQKRTEEVDSRVA